MDYVSIEKDKLNLIIEVLCSYRQFFVMLDKLPIKKSKKMEGNKYKACLDELILYCKSL